MVVAGADLPSGARRFLGWRNIKLMVILDFAMGFLVFAFFREYLQSVFYNPNYVIRNPKQSTPLL